MLPAAIKGLGALAAVWLLVRPGKVAVTGQSMAPTLLPGDCLLTVRGVRVLPGHLVVAPDPRAPARLVVKRAARLTPDGVELAGDNPAASTDSRTFGPVPPRSLRGRVVYRYAPPERAGRVR